MQSSLVMVNSEGSLMDAARRPCPAARRHLLLRAPRTPLAPQVGFLRTSQGRVSLHARDGAWYSIRNDMQVWFLPARAVLLFQ